MIRDQERLLKSDCACVLARTDYHIVCEGFGGKVRLSAVLAWRVVVAMLKEARGEGGGEKKGVGYCAV